MRYFKMLIWVVFAVTMAVMTPSVFAATVSVELKPGNLSITAFPEDLSYTGYTLDGKTHVLDGSFSVTVNDATGSKAGWRLQASITPMTNETGDFLPSANHTITGVSVANATGLNPTNSMSYSMPIPTTTGSIFNVVTGTGRGKSTETFSTRLVIPPDADPGIYTATLTVSIVAGP